MLAFCLQWAGNSWSGRGCIQEGVRNTPEEDGWGLGWGWEAYLDKQKNCCRVSALAAAHCTACCRRRTRKTACGSASPPHMWQSSRSTLSTPHLKLTLLGNRGARGGGWGRKGQEKAMTHHAACCLCGHKDEGRGVKG